MGKGYSSDLRVRIYSELERGESRRVGARRFGVSAATSVRLAQRMSLTGMLECGRQGRPLGGGKLAPYADVLARWVDENGDITMPELVAKLVTECGVTVHPSSFSRFLIKLGFTVRANPEQSGTDCDDGLLQCQRFRACRVM